MSAKLSKIVGLDKNKLKTQYMDTSHDSLLARLYGLESYPEEGTFCVNIDMNDQPGNEVTVCLAFSKYLKTEMKSGETIVGNPKKKIYIYFKDDETIEVKCKKVHVISEEVDVDGKLHVKDDVTFDKKLTVKGDIEAEAKITAKGNISTEGNVSAQGDVTAGATSLKNHTHSAGSYIGNQGLPISGISGTPVA